MSPKFCGNLFKRTKQKNAPSCFYCILWMQRMKISDHFFNNFLQFGCFVVANKGCFFFLVMSCYMQIVCRFYYLRFLIEWLSDSFSIFFIVDKKTSPFLAEILQFNYLCTRSIILYFMKEKSNKEEYFTLRPQLKIIPGHKIKNYIFCENSRECVYKSPNVVGEKNSASAYNLKKCFRSERQ